MTDAPTPESVDPYTLTPEQATAELAAMSAKLAGPAPPANSPSAAAAQLSKLEADPEWRAKFLAGDLASARQRDALQQLAADEILRPPDAIEMIDRVTNPGAVSRAAYESMFDGAREHGYLPPAAEQLIRSLDRGEAIARPTEGDKYACEAALDRLSRDPEWVRRALVPGSAESNLRSVLSHYIALAADDNASVSEFVAQTLQELGLR